MSLVSWQLGLVEREIKDLLRSKQKCVEIPRRKALAMTNDVNNKPTLEQRVITADDICPICQEEFLLHRHPVTFCR